MVENEVRILRRLSHVNVMKLIEELDTKNMLYLVCEYVRGKSFLSRMVLFQVKYRDQFFFY